MDPGQVGSVRHKSAMSGYSTKKPTNNQSVNKDPSVNKYLLWPHFMPPPPATGIYMESDTSIKDKNSMKQLTTLLND